MSDCCMFLPDMPISEIKERYGKAVEAANLAKARRDYWAAVWKLRVGEVEE